MIQGNLRCLKHVVKKGDDYCVKQAWRFEVEGSTGKRKLRLAQKYMMENFCCEVGLGFENADDRVKYREKIRSWKEVSDSYEKRKMLTIIKY